MLKKLLIFMVLLLILFVGAGLTLLPKDVHVERSALVKMPASTVYTLLNGFTSFTAWSPWSIKDPDAIYSLSGPESGIGAKLSWSGNPLIGHGSQEIIATQPYGQIDILLDFGADGHAHTGYKIEPVENGVTLTLTYDTDVTRGQNFYNALIARYVGIMFDRWIGRDFEDGLNNFKVFTERLPKADFSDLKAEVIEVSAWDILYVTSEVEQTPDSIAGALAAAFGEISSFMRDNELFPMAQPLAITRFSESGYSFDAAVPVSLPPGLELSGGVKAGRSPEGFAVKAIHQGSYLKMSGVYEKLGAYMAAHGDAQGDVSWEHYITPPTITDEQLQVTHIYYLINPQDPSS